VICPSDWRLRGTTGGGDDAGVAAAVAAGRCRGGGRADADARHRRVSALRTRLRAGQAPRLPRPLRAVSGGHRRRLHPQQPQLSEFWSLCRADQCEKMHDKEPNNQIFDLKTLNL
jgi:hypothetical protein